MQSTKTGSVLRALVAPAFFVCMVSCVNEDYDINNIDTTVDIYGDLSMPVGNTEFTPVGDFLELDSNEESVLEIDENGNYIIKFDGNPISQSVSIDPINISPDQLIQNGGFNAKVPVKSKITDILPGIGGGDIDQIPLPQIPGEVVAEISLKPADTDIYIHENIAEAAKTVKAIGKIDLDAPVAVRLSIEGLPKGRLTIKKGMKLEFPECISIKEQGSSPVFELKGNVLEFVRPVEVSTVPVILDLIIESIDFSNLPEGQGLIGNFIEISQPIKLTGLTVSADASDFGSKVGDLPYEVSLDIELNVTSVNVNSVQAVIEPEFKIDPQTVNIGELPEFLTGDNIVLDVYNPLIKLNVKNEAPVTVLLNADIVPKFKDAPDGTPVHIGSTDINSEDALMLKKGNTDIYISRRGYDIPSGQIPSGWNAPVNLIVKNLSDIIKKIPDTLSLTDIEADIPHKGNAETGYQPDDYTEIRFPGNSRPVNYEFSFDYGISAPLAFGQELSIEYYTDIKDWNESFNHSKGDSEGNFDWSMDFQEAVIKMTFINAIPLAMDVTAVPIDLNGNEMNKSDISVELDKKVKGGNLGNESITPLEIMMKATPEALKHFDGLRIKIVATSPDPDFQGVSLNKKQGIKLDKITARIKGGISMDLTSNSKE